jgi:CIC family chloride channel protein
MPHMSREMVAASGETVPRPRKGGHFIYIWALAIVVGALAAAGVILIRTLIAYAEFLAFQNSAGRLTSKLAELVWWKRMLGPIVGGALVALLLRLGISMGWGPAPRTFGINDVVQHRRLRGTIRSTSLALRDAFMSAIITVVSLGWGGAAGREEAGAHLGASLAMLPGRLLGLDAAARRMLIAMGLAAAIAAALHAPIAGVFLARELVLRRLRLSALGPVALASATGWLVALTQFGGRPVIDIPDPGLIPPAFHAAALAVTPILTAFAWGAAIIWARTPVMMASAATHIRLPLWFLPFPGGILLGLVAMAFPQVIGIGYEPLATGLSGPYSAQLMPVLALAKIAAAAITFAFRWGGGPIAPALYVGAMIGSTMGVVVGLSMGDAASGQVYFGVLGMAVAFAVLMNAPIAAGLLALELSSSPAIGGVSLACAFLACMAVRRFAPPAPDDEGQTLRWR